MPTSNDHDFSTDQDLSRFVDVAESAARAGGEVLKKWMGKISVTEKNVGDYVTQADIESQNVIRKIIEDAFPTHNFQGEEDVQLDENTGGKKESESTSEFCWIVDPLDGTTNFIHQMQSFSVSIGLRLKDKIVVGCVYDPVIQEMYIGVRGAGATLNGEPIKVSKCTGTKGSLLVCSFPRDIHRGHADFIRFENLICDTEASIRRLGSAALNVCYVACGRLDAYWATALSVWDVAGGSVILEEAGGQLHSIDPKVAFNLNEPRFIATATPELFEALAPHMIFES